MKHIDLFSGIGGFALAAGWTWGQQHEIATFCEIDPFCREVLQKHYPTVPIIEDVKDVEHELKADTYGLLTAGLPCQPHSYAGKRAGAADERYLWAYVARIIGAYRPRWVILENVPGIITDGTLDSWTDDLAAYGYETEVLVLPAYIVGAAHRRNRVWIIAADYQSERMEGLWTEGEQKPYPLAKQVLPIRNSNGLWEVEPDLRRTTNGLPRGLHVSKRLKALGNAIVPQAAAQIMRAIKAADEEYTGAE